MIKNSKQTWEIGQTVNVGFLKNLQVVEKIPTPGDYAPDAYVLIARSRQPNGLYTGSGTWYRFVPHKGISRCTSLTDARIA